MGFDSVTAMVHTVRTGQVAPSEDTGVTFVTQQNINDPRIQATLKPTCDRPPA
jgi:hypothetical protein